MAKSTIPKRTWQYGNEFKITVVKLSYQEDLQVKEVAEMLDTHPFMLSRWRKEYREGKLQGDHKKRIGTRMKKSKVSAKEMTENARLKYENERLKKNIFQKEKKEIANFLMATKLLKLVLYCVKQENLLV
ncbi:MAG: transposase [Gammaproteobacteria bacterium]|nr:transposase [Gammaproteobacteria bacterium]